MSILGRLFGTEKAIDTVSSAIDKTILTDEERIDLKVEIWKAAHPFKIAQRLFMLMVTVPYMLAWMINVAYAIMEKENSALTAILSGRVGDVFLAMAVFYFGGGAINTISDFRNNKK